jgi:hypothetical protein
LEALGFDEPAEQFKAWLQLQSKGWQSQTHSELLPHSQAQLGQVQLQAQAAQVQAQAPPDDLHVPEQVVQTVAQAVVQSQAQFMSL